MNPYYTYKNYMLKTYNKALYSIAVDLDLSCPNRDENGNNGCTFCPSNGARAAQSLSSKDLEEQIIAGITFAKTRYKAQHFMLYIQAYTGTFTTLQNQKDTYSKLLKMNKFEAISIGTRPDCLNKDTLEYLIELNKSIDVHIDLGVQTFNDKTLKKINRGHTSSQSIEAIKKLKKYGIKVFAHIIVGFENEDRDDYLNSIKQLVSLDVNGIKIHNLHIIKDTLLEKTFKKKPFKILNEYEYAKELIFLIRNIPSHIPIIRIQTDTAKENLIAPLWNMQKGQFSSYVLEQMNYQDYKQGDLIQKIISEKKEEKIIQLDDGSITVFDKKFKDYYHCKSGAYRQAKELFINKSNLKNRLKKSNVKLLDLGFGMGFNSLCAILLQKDYNLDITALDMNKNIIKTSYENINNEKEKEIIKEIYDNSFYKNENNILNLILGEIRDTLFSLKNKYDVIFLDPFVHTSNASLLSIQIFRKLFDLLNHDGVIVCSSSSRSTKVALSKSAFKSCDFSVQNTDIMGLWAIKGKNEISGSFYDDPHLIYRDKQILINYEKSK